MTISDPQGARAGLDPWSRIKEASTILIVAAAVLAILVAGTGLRPLHALAAFAAIVAAAALRPRRSIASASSSVPRNETPNAPEASLDAIISGLPDPVIILDDAGRVRAFNGRARGVVPALQIGEPALLVLRMPAIVEAIRTAIATREPQQVEFSERVPTDRWYEAHVVPIPAQTGPRIGLMLLTLRDLTPLRRVEEMRVDFVANASHELRTPLASLSGFIDTLQGPARDDTAARERFLDIMKGQARRMARLIDDLLSLSRIELNAHQHPEAPVDLVPVVRQVVDSLQMLAREREVEVAIDAPPDSLVVAGDRDELIRLFENLVENAMKYAVSGKRVEISLRRELMSIKFGDEAVVSVRDHGPGIAPEHLPRLTERFYRIDVGKSRAEGGTGLGLALVKHILNRHRGRLAIESTLGQGATFTVHLPLMQALKRGNGDHT
jgi:two-component system phosphate regulon sensor histidine kinase PhoR